MTRLRAALACVVCLLLLPGWTHGFQPTALIIDAAGAQVVGSAGASIALTNRLLPGSSYKLVCAGDSITMIPQAPPGYCSYTSGLLASGRSIAASFKSFGMGGYSWEYTYSTGAWPGQTMDSMAPSQVDVEIYQGLRNVLVLFAGTNGMSPTVGNHSAATEFADFQTYYAARKAAGWADANIIVVTTLPRESDATFAGRRATYNASLVTFCGTNGCRISNAGADATIGCGGCETNTTYYNVDQVHLNDTGQSYLATNLIYPQVP